MKHILQLASRGWHATLDLLFPPHCIGCGADGATLCPRCDAAMHAHPTTQRDLSALDGLHIASRYHDNPILVRAIENMKYKSNTALTHALGALLSESVEPCTHGTRCIVSFVPLSTKRQRQRGFNQAEKLARVVADTHALPLVATLTRTRDTMQQAKLPRHARLTNVVGAFATRPDADVRDAVVILVDDVASTGSTLSACAYELRSAGARAVWGLVLARG